MKDAYGLAKRFAAMPPRWGWIKDVARLIEQDREEARAEERKACADRLCAARCPGVYSSADSAHACVGCASRAAILSVESDERSDCPSCASYEREYDKCNDPSGDADPGYKCPCYKARVSKEGK